MGDAVYIRVTLQRGAQIGYEGEVRVGLDGPTDRTGYRLLLDEAGLHRLDLARPVEYGQALWKLLFGAQAAHLALLRGVEQAWNCGIPVRLQLHVHESARELAHLAWELLRTPRGGWLACSQGILFSRYLPLQGPARWVRENDPASPVPGMRTVYAPVRLPVHPSALPSSLAHPQHTPLVLAAVSCPADNRIDHLRFNAEGELAAVRAAISGQVDTLSACPGEPATLDRLVDHLASGSAGRPYEILYLACCTRPNRGFPGLALLFEPAAGREALVQEDELAQRLASLPVQARPRLLVLASHDLPDVDASEPGERAWFGHSLAQAGIPAVLTTHGAARSLLPVFFKELFQHGLPDRALAQARRSARGEDWWQPVLYLHGPSLPL